jgi:hypothetical protein
MSVKWKNQILSKECMSQPRGKISANGAGLAHCEIGAPPTQSVRMSAHIIWTIRTTSIMTKLDQNLRNFLNFQRLFFADGQSGTI